MAYSFQTFTVAQVLTASQMNQVEVNIRDHVHGTASVGSTFTKVELPAGTAAAPSLRIGGDTKGLFELGANQLGFAVGSALAAQLDLSQFAVFQAKVVAQSAADESFQAISTGAASSAYLLLIGRQASVDSSWSIVSTGSGLGALALRFVKGGFTAAPFLTIDANGALQLGNIAAATGFTNAGDITAAVTNASRNRSSFSAWVRHNNAGTITRALNVGSVTKNSTGNYTANITTSVMADGSYGYVFSSGGSTGGVGVGQDTTTAPTATALRYITYTSPTGAALDAAGDTFAGVLP